MDENTKDVLLALVGLIGGISAVLLGQWIQTSREQGLKRVEAKNAVYAEYLSLLEQRYADLRGELAGDNAKWARSIAKARAKLVLVSGRRDVRSDAERVEQALGRFADGIAKYGSDEMDSVYKDNRAAARVDIDLLAAVLSDDVGLAGRP
jgi:hypothetical protein